MMRTDNVSAHNNLWKIVLEHGEPPRGGKRASCASVVYSQKIRDLDSELRCDETLVDVLHTIVKPTGQRPELLKYVLTAVDDDPRALAISQGENIPTPLVVMKADKPYPTEHAAIRVVEEHTVQVSKNSGKNGILDLKPVDQIRVIMAYRVSSPRNKQGSYLLSDLKVEIESVGKDGNKPAGNPQTLGTVQDTLYTPPKPQQDTNHAAGISVHSVEQHCTNLLERRISTLSPARSFFFDNSILNDYKLKRQADQVMRNRAKTAWQLIDPEIAYNFAEETDAQIISAQNYHPDEIQLHEVVLDGIRCDQTLVDVLKDTLKPTADRGGLLSFLESCVKGTDIRISAAGVTIENPSIIIRPVIDTTSGSPVVSAVRVTEAHCVKVMRVKKSGETKFVGRLEALVEFTIAATQSQEKCELCNLKVIVRPMDADGKRSVGSTFSYSSTYSHFLPISHTGRQRSGRLGKEKFHVPDTYEVATERSTPRLVGISRVKLKNAADKTLCSIAHNPWALIKTEGYYDMVSASGAKLQLNESIGDAFRDEQIVKFARDVIQPTSVRPGLLAFMQACIDTKKTTMRVAADHEEPTPKVTMTYTARQGTTPPTVKVEEIHQVKVIDIDDHPSIADLLFGRGDGKRIIQDQLKVRLTYTISVADGQKYVFGNMHTEIWSMGHHGNKKKEPPLAFSINTTHTYDAKDERDPVMDALLQRAGASLRQAARRQPAVATPHGRDDDGGGAPTTMLKASPDSAMRDAASTPWDLIYAGHDADATPADDNILKFTEEYLLRPTKYRDGLLEFVRACVQDGDELNMATKAPRIEVDVEQDDRGLPIGPCVVEEEHYVRISRDSDVLDVLQVQVTYKVKKTETHGEYILSDLNVVVKSLGSDGNTPSARELKYSIKATERVSREGPVRPVHRKSTTKTKHPDNTESDEQDDIEKELRDRAAASLKKTVFDGQDDIEKELRDRAAASLKKTVIKPQKGETQTRAQQLHTNHTVCHVLVKHYGLPALVLGKNWNAGGNQGKSDIKLESVDEQQALLSAVLDDNERSCDLLVQVLQKSVRIPGVRLVALQNPQITKQNTILSDCSAAIRVREEHKFKVEAVDGTTNNLDATLSYVISADRTAQHVTISGVELQVAIVDTGDEQNITFEGTESIKTPCRLLEQVSKRGAQSSSGSVRGNIEDVVDIDARFKSISKELEQLADSIGKSHGFMPGNASAFLVHVLQHNIKAQGVTLTAKPNPKVTQHDIETDDGLVATVFREQHKVNVVWHDPVCDMTKNLGDLDATLSYTISNSSTPGNAVVSDVKLSLDVAGKRVMEDVSLGNIGEIKAFDSLSQGAADNKPQTEDTELGQRTKRLISFSGIDAEGFSEIKREAAEVFGALGASVKGVAQHVGHTSGVVTPKEITLSSNHKACHDLVKSVGLPTFVWGQNWVAKNQDDKGTTPNLENLSIGERQTLLLTVLDTAPPHGTHESLMEVLAGSIGTPGTTLTATTNRVTRNIEKDTNSAAIRVQEEHTAAVTWRAITSGAPVGLGNVNATLSYTISADTDTQHVTVSDVKLKVAVVETGNVQNIDFDGTEKIKISNTLLRKVADKLRGVDPVEQVYVAQMGETAAGAHTARQTPTSSNPQAQEGPKDGAGDTPVAGQPRDGVNIAVYTCLADNSATPAQRTPGSAAPHATQPHAAARAGGESVFALKSEPDQIMRDAIPNPWAIIDAGQYHQDNRREAQHGNIEEFCSKFLHQETCRRSGLLDFVKSSITCSQNANIIIAASKKARGSTRARSPKSDRSMIAEVIVTEHHEFNVLSDCRVVGSLKARVQYTVRPTVILNKYSISDLQVTIQHEDSGSKLEYNSTSYHEVGLPGAQTEPQPQKLVTSSTAAQQLSDTASATIEQKVAAAVTEFGATRTSSDPAQSANIAKYLESISKPSSSGIGGPPETTAEKSSATDTQSLDAGTGVVEQAGDAAKSAPQLVASAAGSSNASAHRNTCELKRKPDQEMRAAAATPWNLVYDENTHKPGGQTPQDDSIIKFIKEYLLRPTPQRKGMLEFAKACVHNGDGLVTHATGGPKIKITTLDHERDSPAVVEEVHNIEIKNSAGQVLDVVAAKVSYKVSSTATPGEYLLSNMDVVVKSLGPDGQTPSATELSYSIQTSEHVSREKQPAFVQNIAPTQRLSATAGQDSDQARLRAQAATTLTQAAQRSVTRNPCARSITTQTGTDIPPDNIILNSSYTGSTELRHKLHTLALGNNWMSEHTLDRSTDIDPSIFSSARAQLMLLSAVLDEAPDVTHKSLLDVMQGGISTSEVALVVKHGTAPVVTRTVAANSSGSPVIKVQEEHETTATHTASGKAIDRVCATLSYTIHPGRCVRDAAYVVISNLRLKVVVESTGDELVIDLSSEEEEVAISGNFLKNIADAVCGRASVATQSGGRHYDESSESYKRSRGVAALFASGTQSEADNSDVWCPTTWRAAAPQKGGDDAAFTAPHAAAQERAKQSEAASQMYPETASSAGATPKDGVTWVGHTGIDDGTKLEAGDSDPAQQGQSWSTTQILQAMQTRRKAETAAQSRYESQNEESDSYETDTEDEEEQEDVHLTRRDDRNLLTDSEADVTSMRAARTAAKQGRGPHHTRRGRTQNAEASGPGRYERRQTEQSAKRGTAGMRLFSSDGKLNFVDKVKRELRSESLRRTIFYPRDDVEFGENLLLNIAEISVAPPGKDVVDNLQIVGDIHSDVYCSEESQEEYTVAKSATVDAGIHGKLHISVRYQVAREISVYSTRYTVKNATINLGPTANSGTTVLPVSDTVSEVDTPWRAAVAEYSTLQGEFRAHTSATDYDVRGYQKSGVAREKKRTKQQPIPEFSEESVLHIAPHTSGKSWLRKILDCVCGFFGKIFKFLLRCFGAQSDISDDSAQYVRDTHRPTEDGQRNSRAAHLLRTSDYAHTYHPERDASDYEYSDADDSTRPPSEVVSDSTIHSVSGRRAATTRKGLR